MNKMDDFVVALVISNWTVQKIHDFLEDFLDAKKEDIGFSKIERYKNKKGETKDSNRTLFLLKKSLYGKALNSGLDLQQPNLDFRICEFTLSAKNYPYEGYTNNFFIKLPNALPAENAESIVNEKMKILIEFGLLKNGKYSLKIPLNSRITGEHKGFLLCKFEESVDIRIRSLIRALLHDSLLFMDSQNNMHYLSVFWSKNYKLPAVPEYKILKKE